MTPHDQEFGGRLRPRALRGPEDLIREIVDSDRSPTSKAEVDDSIDQLLLILTETNPLELLGQAAFYHLRAGPDEFASGTTHSEGQLEYLISLVAARAFPSSARKAVPDTIQGCLDLLDSVFRKATRHFMDGSREDRAEELLNLIRLGSLHHRGKAFGQHIDRLFHEIAPSHDSFLKKHYGFKAAEFREFINYACECQTRLLEKRRAEFRRIADSLAAQTAALLGVRASDSLDPERWLTATELADFRATHAVEIETYFAAIDSFGAPTTFETTPRNETDARILAAIAQSFGENHRFLEGIKKWRGWPLNPSLIREKPILQHAGKYYIFHLPFLLRGALDIVEALVRSADKNYWKDRFLPRRDRYVEDSAISLLTGAFPGCETLQGAYYDSAVDGEAVKRVEADGIIIYDDVLLLVEAKASGLSESTRRGARGSFGTDLEESIEAAYQQSVRLLRTLQASDEVVLYDRQGSETGRVRYSDYRYVFLISVTRENFACISTRLPLLRELGFLKGAEWPWVVDLHALRTLTELLPRPALLLHYIRRRIAVNDTPKIFAVDEFDLIGLFFSCDLQLSEELTKDFAIVLSWDACAEISQYYAALQTGEPVTKPKYPIAGRAAALLDALAREQPRHFASISLRILDILAANRTAFEDFLTEAERAFKGRGMSRLAVFGNMRRADVPCFALATSLLSKADLALVSLRAKIQKSKLQINSLSVIVWRPPLKRGRVEILEI